jgi:hypothetical protein
MINLNTKQAVKSVNAQYFVYPKKFKGTYKPQPLKIIQRQAGTLH